MRTPMLAMLGLSAALLTGPSASAQVGSPNTTPGPVTRVILIHIIPGQADAFWQDMRQHLKPVYEEYKRRGIITNYTVGTKSTTESPNDWNVVLTLSYANWAAFDNLAALTEPVTLAHYGTAAQRTMAASARVTHATTVSSFLVRAQTVNDWK
jgi:hypothetical protein